MTEYSVFRMSLFSSLFVKGYAFDSEKEFGVIRPESLLRGRDSL